MGADHAVSYHDDWPAAIQEFTDGEGVDVILDVIGARYLEPNVTALAAGGRLVVIGLQGGGRGTLDLGLLLRKRGHVIATSLRGRPVAEKSEICALVECDRLAAADFRRDQAVAPDDLPAGRRRRGPPSARVRRQPRQDRPHRLTTAERNRSRECRVDRAWLASA